MRNYHEIQSNHPQSMFDQLQTMFLFENKTQTARLRYKSLKIIQEQLSLPVIPERVKYQHALSSPTPPSKQHNHKFQSYEPVCPQEERLDYNIRAVLDRLQNYTHSPNKIREKGKKDRSNGSLPKIQIIQKIRNLSARQIHAEALIMAKRPHSATKFKIDFASIIRNKEEFAANYFKELKGIAR